MEVTLFVLLCMACLDSFVVMMERGSSMREMRIVKGGCYALIFAAVNAVMMFLGMNLSQLVVHTRMLQGGRVMSAMVFVMLGTFLLLKAVSYKHFEERLDLAFSYRKGLIQAVFNGIDAMMLGIALGLLGVMAWSTCAVMFVLTFIAIHTALWIGYYRGAACQRGMMFLSCLAYYAATLWILLPL